MHSVRFNVQLSADLKGTITFQVERAWVAWFAQVPHGAVLAALAFSVVPHPLGLEH
jgi:hypothetical protein